MNLNIKKSASKTKINMKKGLLFLSAIILASAGVFAMLGNDPVSADQYDDKIAALQADMARYQAETDRLNAEATTLQNALAQLANERAALQARIDVSQIQFDQLTAQIIETEAQIVENQDALGATIADLYVDDSISPVEMLASSQSIGDFLDRQEYRNSVKDELSATIKTIKDLKTQLSEQKIEVEKVLNQQKSARDSLVAKQNEQSVLLARTQNDESEYQNLIKDSEAQIAEAKAVQAALRARTTSTGGYTIVDAGSLSAYPWNESNCPMWGYLSTQGANGNGGDGWGYGCRQCASYVGWRVARETGVYYRWGNGGDFARNAIAAGYQDLGQSPQAGSLAVLWGNPGHVAWVEAVSGNQVLVSQYNYNYGDGWGMYSEMWLSVNFFDQYVKIT